MTDIWPTSWPTLWPTQYLFQDHAKGSSWLRCQGSFTMFVSFVCCHALATIMLEQCITSGAPAIVIKLIIDNWFCSCFLSGTCGILVGSVMWACLCCYLPGEKLPVFAHLMWAEYIFWLFTFCCGILVLRWPINSNRYIFELSLMEYRLSVDVSASEVFKYAEQYNCFKYRLLQQLLFWP